jgi:hypothetical protein
MYLQQITRTTARLSTKSCRPMSALASQKAKEHQASGWKGTTTDGGETKSYINGEWTEIGGKAEKWFDVNDPVCSARSLLFDKMVTLLIQVDCCLVHSNFAHKSTSTTSFCLESNHRCSSDCFQDLEPNKCSSPTEYYAQVSLLQFKSTMAISLSLHIGV